MKGLIHVCCANCLIYPLKVLHKKGWEMTGYFYNPNIHPYREYRQRLETVKEYERQTGVKVTYRDEYDLEGFLRGVVYREHERCKHCYYSRLEATAQAAKGEGFDAFTTTLLYSKHQNHSLIKEIGESLAKQFSVRFHYEDFREWWQEGIRESKAMGLYRQQYCGCIYSEKERYGGKKK
ncbi:MAG: epoxyqueuosine reductase QueH [Syntrophobacterales bacterium]|nr:MAG: epoxyqueuosine reductase QueH [Syntrophobacterales bacterium]